MSAALSQAQTSAPAGKGPAGPAAAPSSSMGSESRGGSEGRANAPGGDDSMTRNAAARTRMLECGHQWSAKKRAGTAIGTWKDFFKVCVTRP